MDRETILVRQTATSAKGFVDELVGEGRKSITDALLADFAAEEGSNGELSVEFLQGFYSGLSYAMVWFINTRHNLKDVGVMSPLAHLTVAAGRKYVTEFEREAKKR